MPFLPFQGLYVITCVDPRTDPGDFLRLRFAEAIVARTLGGRVTDAVSQDLSYIGYLVETKVPEGPYVEVVVIHHTDCGTRLLEDPAPVPAETVRADERKILAAPQISPCITVSGLVYDTATGLLEMVAEPAHPTASMELVVERPGIAVAHAVAG